MTDSQTTDTRKKLEADVQVLTEQWGRYGGNFMRVYGSVAYAQIIGLLDRQAAITEQHWMEIVGASANANVELKRQIDELQAKLDQQKTALQSERENELGKALIEVAEKWAIARVEAEDRAKRCMLLEGLVRDMWREMLTCPDYATSPCMTSSICERVRNLEIEV